MVLGVAAAPDCGALRNVVRANTTIVAAARVDSGKFSPPPTAVRAPSSEIFVAYNALAAFCRVEIVVRPTGDSNIRVEVWLPLTGWNGRYLGTANGSYGGSIGYSRLGEGLRSGYVTSSTDTGHRGRASQRAWAKGHPQKQADFDYRAMHETAQIAKVLIRAMYGSPPRFSYFNGCSNGGRQGLMEAERYADDYDGVLAGAPATTFGYRTFVTGNLSEFQERGGKLIVYHGGNDAPETSVKYLSKARAKLGEEATRKFAQLYVVPGMGHCGSGAAPNDVGQWLRPDDDRAHSLLKALEHWVENGVAPDSVVATKFTRNGDPSSGVVRTRTLRPR
jgi:hypothetical protein